MDGVMKGQTQLGFDALKLLKERYRGNVSKLTADWSASKAPYQDVLDRMHHLSRSGQVESNEYKTLLDKLEQRLVKPARDYAFRSKAGDLLMDLAIQDGWNPVDRKTFSQVVPDLTRRVQVDEIAGLAFKLDNLAAAAEKSGNLKRVVKLSARGKLGAFLLSSAVCSLFLGYIVPKSKQYLTYRLTGTHQFPGTM